MTSREQFEAFLIGEYEWAEGALNAAIFCGDDATGHYVCGEHIYDRQDCSECLFWAWRGWQAAYKESEQKLAALAANNALLKGALLEEGYRYFDADTEVTDAYLAEVRAQVWIEAKELAKSAVASDSIDHIDFLFDGKAAQLRQGAKS